MLVQIQSTALAAKIKPEAFAQAFFVRTVNLMNPPSPNAEPTQSPEQLCPNCQRPFVPTEGQEVCGDCASQRTLLWVIGLGLLFFCFIALPLLIQLLGTPRPD